MKKTVLAAILACTLAMGGALVGCSASSNTGTTGNFKEDTADGVVAISSIKDEPNPMGAKVTKLSSSDLTKLQNEMIALTNEARDDRGRADLRKATRLQKSSKIRAAELDRRWSHTRPNGTKWSTTLKTAGIKMKNISYGENLAMICLGARADYTDKMLETLAEDLHDGLMGSTSHRNTLLRSKYKYVGISAWSTVEDGLLYVYVTEHFTNKKA
ncbi:MAG: CAP domain-containing protein [Eggerthellales bacterium]|nr:CAP domain-containing protein [Eggerthellales bacterium]